MGRGKTKRRKDKEKGITTKKGEKLNGRKGSGKRRERLGEEEIGEKREWEKEK